MIHGSPEIWNAPDRIFLSSRAIFCPYTPLTAWKMKISKQWNKGLEISFYTSVPKIMIICYTVPEIWHVTDVLLFFILGYTFPFYPHNSPKNENFKKMKKGLEISSFYTSVPKIIIIYYTVPEIWYVTHVIIFYFWLFFALLPP